MLRLRWKTSCASPEKLDELGIDYIEGGWPGSNPRDAEFFKRVKKLQAEERQGSRLRHDHEVRRQAVPGYQSERLLLAAETPVVTMVGKTWDLHVRDDLRISQKANLELIADSVALHEKARRRSDLRRRALLRRLPRQPGVRARVPQGGAGRRRRLDRAVRDQWRAAARRGSRRAATTSTARSRRRSASTATTTASWRWPTRSPAWRWASPRCRAPSTVSASAAAT